MVKNREGRPRLVEQTTAGQYAHRVPSATHALPPPVAVADIPVFCAANLPPATITVELVTARVREDFQEGIREITSKRQLYHKAWYTLGLTSAQFVTGSSYVLNTLRVPGTTVTCSRPDVKFTVGISKHEVQVGQELRQDSCGFGIVLEHEYRHVRVNEAAAQYARDTLEAELRQRYSGSVSYGNPIDAKGALANEISQHWLPRLNQLLETGLLAHKSIDTPQEYASNSTVCGGEIPRRMREAGVSVQYKPSEM